MTTEKEIKKKEKKKEKTNLKLASRRLIQILGINPKIPVAIQNKIKDIQTAKDAEDKGLPWINQILSVLGKVPESRMGAKGQPHKKGGAVKKYAQGGAVSSGHALTYKRK
jgi:hypothetical protein